MGPFQIANDLRYTLQKQCQQSIVLYTKKHDSASHAAKFDISFTDMEKLFPSFSVPWELLNPAPPKLSWMSSNKDSLDGFNGSKYPYILASIMS